MLAVLGVLSTGTGRRPIRRHVVLRGTVTEPSTHPGGTRSRPTLRIPNHVAIVIHNYRWRIGAAAGEPQFAELEARLAESPEITVPTVTLEGDANGAPHPDPAAYAGKFTGQYEHRTIPGGVGHNLPQEAPQAFAQAVMDVAARGSSKNGGR